MKKFLYLLLVISPFLLIGCDDDDNDNTGDNIVEITDDITSPTTWYADSVYVITSHDFWVSSTLTIQAGTIIKLGPTGPGISANANGTIIANGTAEKPICFTSINDDSKGGDVNHNGTSTAPAAGDWGGVLIEGNGSSFTNCYFIYGGSSTYLSSLEIYSGRATITNCHFLFNKGGKMGDFYYGALDASSADKETQIKNNEFYGNVIPLSLSSIIDMDNSNVFSNPEDNSVKNTMNGIFIYDIDGIIRAVSWDETEVPFVINDNDLWIESPGSLNLGDNVIVKFTPASTLVIGIGAEINQGANNAFTSFKDDLRLGDTNGDNDATNPSVNDWEGIYDDATDYQTWANIYYDSH